MLQSKNVRQYFVLGRVPTDMFVCPSAFHPCSTTLLPVRVAVEMAVHEIDGCAPPAL